MTSWAPVRAVEYLAMIFLVTPGPAGLTGGYLTATR